MNERIKDAQPNGLNHVSVFVEEWGRNLVPDPETVQLQLRELLEDLGTFLAPGQAVAVGETPGRVVVRALGRDFFCSMADVYDVLDMTARLQMYTSEPLA